MPTRLLRRRHHRALRATASSHPPANTATFTFAGGLPKSAYRAYIFADNVTDAAGFCFARRLILTSGDRERINRHGSPGDQARDTRAGGRCPECERDVA